MSIIDCLGGVISVVSFWLYTGILVWIAMVVIQTSGIPRWSLLIAFPLILIISLLGAALTVRGMFVLMEKFHSEDSALENGSETQEDTDNPTK